MAPEEFDDLLLSLIKKSFLKEINKELRKGLKENMTLEEYREIINPCYGYDCYDEDLGCIMPRLDRPHACPLKDKPFPFLEGVEKEHDN